MNFLAKLMTKPIRIAIVFLLAFFSALSSQHAQEKAQNPVKEPEQDSVVRIGTQLVQVDVVVTDKNNRHVEDLADSEFELYVDGKKQPLTHFSRVKLSRIERELPKKNPKADKAAPESMPTKQIAAEEVRRTLAFIVDDLGLSIGSTERVKETLRRFVAEQMQEGDLVAIIRTGSGLGMLEQFTSDKRVLYAAIEKLQWNPLSRDMAPSFADSTEELTEDQTEMQSSSQTLDQFREMNFSMGTLGAISFVVRALRDQPGRKSVMLLSDGFAINQSSGMGSAESDVNTIRLIAQMEQLVELANRSSVVVYSMDAKGLQPFTPDGSTGGRPAASSYGDALDKAQEALEGPTFIAKQTGGFVVTNTNDLNIGVQEALYDQQHYYLLGYDPDDEKFDRKKHSISVKVTRPGMKVRTRAGFFGITEEERKAEPVKSRGKQLLAGLLSPLNKRDVSLQMTPYFFNSSKEGPLVRTLFHIDCSKLTFKEAAEGKKHVDLDLALFAFDETGAPIDLAVRQIKLDLDEAQYKRAMAEGLAYRADFTMKKAGAYQVRGVVRDAETGAAGSASQFIQVPDLSKNRLGISGLILTAPKGLPPISGENKAPLSEDVAVENTPSNDKTDTPDLSASPFVRRFPRTGWVQYGVGIYNATADKKTGKPQVSAQAEIYQNGKAMFQFKPREIVLAPGGNAKRFDYVGRLRLKDFPAGEYLLHLVVTDPLAKKKFGRAEQWIDFSVR